MTRIVPLTPPPAIAPCTVDTTPEEWSEAHRALLHDHAVTVSPWGALCESCGALWTRDPAKGGPDRRRPS